MSDRIELVEPLSAAVEQTMNGIGAGLGLPPLFWSLRRDGELGGFPCDDGVEAAARWAAALGLGEPTDEQCFRCWRGVVSVYRVEIFARIADDVDV